MRPRDSYDGLEALVADRGDVLLRAAVLLAGSRPAGEDLLQTALERLVRNWRRVDGDKEAYLRRTVYHLAVDHWRVRRRRPEVLAEVEPPAEPDATDGVHLRYSLLQALAVLPPRQRAVLVLRYWEQLSEADAARVLGCSVGTIKSSASRGLARLREVTAVWTTDEVHASNGAAQ